MCLVLKLDNGKVVSIADEQKHPVPYYYIYYFIYDGRAPIVTAMAACPHHGGPLRASQQIPGILRPYGIERLKGRPESGPPYH